MKVRRDERVREKAFRFSGKLIYKKMKRGKPRLSMRFIFVCDLTIEITSHYYKFYFGFMKTVVYYYPSFFRYLVSKCF